MLHNYISTLGNVLASIRLTFFVIHYIQSKFLSENIKKQQSTICYIEKKYPVVICLSCLATFCKR